MQSKLQSRNKLKKNMHTSVEKSIENVHGENIKIQNSNIYRELSRNSTLGVLQVIYDFLCL